MNNVFQQLAKSYPSHCFMQVEAEKVDELAESFNIISVPSFVFIKNGKEIDRLTGADPLELAKKIEIHTGTKENQTTENTLNERLQKLVNLLILSTLTSLYFLKQAE